MIFKTNKSALFCRMDLLNENVLDQSGLCGIKERQTTVIFYLNESAKGQQNGIA
jgi:hypothetical protein